MSVTQPLFVTYEQIAVFGASLADPFNDWMEAHVNQGFAWRPGSVSFRTKVDGCSHEVTVTCHSHVKTEIEGVRVIEVPFVVSGNDPVLIASIGDEFPVDIPEGSYALRFSIGTDDPCHITLSFIETDKPEFRILRADADLSPSEPLISGAHPA
jgi:hypothetical protein